MPDLSLLVALMLGVGGVVVWSLRRRKAPKLPRCADCKLDMEHDADIPEELTLGNRLALDMGPANSRIVASLYHCPKCNKKARVRH